MIKTNVVFVLASLLLMGPGGCSLFRATAGQAGGDDEQTSEPAWIERGTTLVHDGDTRAFIGVGAARGKLSAALLKTAARKKARDAVTGPLTAFIKTLVQGWPASLSPKEKEEISVRRVLDHVRERMQKRSVVDEVYIAPNKRAAFALARLDLTAAVMALQTVSEAESLRRYLDASQVDPQVVFDRVSSGPPKAEAQPRQPAKSAEAAEQPGGKKKAAPETK